MGCSSASGASAPSASKYAKGSEDASRQAPTPNAKITPGQNGSTDSHGKSGNAGSEHPHNNSGSREDRSSPGNGHSGALVEEAVELPGARRVEVQLGGLMKDVDGDEAHEFWVEDGSGKLMRVAPSELRPAQ